MKLFDREAVDERQKQELQSVGSNAFWVLFYFLVLSVAVQGIFFKPNLQQIGAEVLGIIVGGVALVVGCVRRGLWDFGHKMTQRNYLLFSGIAALLMLPISFLILRRASVSWLIFPAIAAATFVACYLLILAFARLIKRNQKKLEAEVDDREN